MTQKAKSIAAMTLRERWTYALKPASWPKLLVPALVGQGAGVAAAGTLDLVGFFVGMLVTATTLVFIVTLNDWADLRVDAIKRRMFPDGCSPKTIVDGILPGRALLLAGACAGVLAIVTALFGGWLLKRPWLAESTMVCLAIFVAYTLPPIKLNYRGGGELLEMIGVGTALPLLNAYIQSGADIVDPALAILPGTTLMALSSALASGLADEESDRIGGKRTFATMLGNGIVRRATEVSLVAGIALWVVGGLVTALPLLVVLPGAAIAGFFVPRLLNVSPRARTNAFSGIRRYKLELHRAIWWSGAALALALAIAGLFAPDGIV